ncbi:hypothetical protein BH10CHL1_BH10CHL1_43410 [soil metagenome]
MIFARLRACFAIISPDEEVYAIGWQVDNSGYLN